MSNNNTKTCSKCGTEKELSEFYNRKVAKDGKTTSCKECNNVQKHEYYIENKDVINANQKQYRDTHKDEIKIKDATWNKENPNYHKEYHAKHPEVLRKSSRKVRARKMSWEEPKAINAEFEGSHLHHTHLNGDTSFCINIPSDLHKSVWHAYNKPETMAVINKLAFEWVATQETI